MRNLTEHEKNNIEILTQNSVSLTLIEPTATALIKSIMDATGIVRTYLKSTGYHDYTLQGQGIANKVKIESYIYFRDKAIKADASLYRPTTKKGDPRIWFSKLHRHVNPSDILALICFDSKIHILNLTQLSISYLLNRITLPNPVKELVNEINGINNAIANELLKFRMSPHCKIQLVNFCQNRIVSHL